MPGAGEGRVVARAAREPLRALAAVNFFIAAIQTGFGPFLALGLTRQGWTQEQIGFALSAGTVAALVCQLPGGALVDAVHDKRSVLAAALALTGTTALVLAASGAIIPVVAAQILHAAAATVLTPAIAAVTLTCAGHAAFSRRLGSNSRYASLGSAGAALLLGALASWLSARAVFLMTALLCGPAILAAWRIRPLVGEGGPDPDHPSLLHPAMRRERGHRFWAIYEGMSLHGFAVCILLFQAGNAAMLPIAVDALAAREGAAAGLVVSAAILVSQAVVAILSPWLGEKAEIVGRRPILLLGFGALPLKGLLLAAFPGAVPLVLSQLLDGVSGAVMAIMIALIAADLTRRTGFMNLAIGSLGLATGLGATVSTSVGGWIATHAGAPAALFALSGAGLLATCLLWLIFPETRVPVATTEPLPAQA